MRRRTTKHKQGLFIRFSKNGLLTVFRHTWTLLATFLVILAIFFTLFRALTPLVKQYRPQIQQQLSLWAGQDISIHDIETSWYWFTPVLRLNQVVIHNAQQHALRFNQVMVGIDLFSSILHWQVQPGVLYVDEAHLKIHQTEDNWKIEGFDLPNMAAEEDVQASDILPFIGILLAQDKVILKHVSAELSLKNGVHIPLTSLNFKADHHGQNYRIYSKAIIGKNPDIHMTVIANLSLDGNDLHKLSGQIYMSVSHADLPWLQTLIPQFPSQIKRGSAAVDAWFDLVHGHVTRVQASVDTNDLALLEPGRAKPRLFSTFTANMAWQRLSQGWQVSADHVFFTLDGVAWPENVLRFVHSGENADDHLYIKTVPFKQLLLTDLPWPAVVKPWLALKPKGALLHTELSWQNGQIHNLLTKFSHVSWRPKDKIPGLSGLSGAIYWQPSEGRLEVDGDHTILSMQKPLAPIPFDTFNGALDWKYLSQGLRLSLERLVLTHPNLVLSAAGAVDDPFGAAAHARVQMDFSAKDAQVWLPYIPSKGLKPKLDYWLKNGILKIAKASGQMRLSGLLSDFPFDNQNGEFSIQSHVNGVDMLINKDWPMNEDIDADIHLNGRNFLANVGQATLAGVPVHQVSISIPDIGLGKEMFLLHGVVKAPGDQIKAYVFASPLQKRFARWKAVSIEDPLGLELNLEVPLYPESDHVYAKGSLDFDQNIVSVDVVDNAAEFSDVSGRLQYSEYGLTSGSLNGILDGYPFTMQVQPLLGPKAGTELRFESEIDIDYLQYLVHHPAFSLMQGRVIVTGLWSVYPENADKDTLYLNTSLVGMALHLPKPFGKSIAEIVPMTVKVDFAPQQKMDLHLTYGQKAIGMLTMQHTANNHWRTTGDLHIGPGDISRKTTQGLRLSGTLANVNIDAWQRVLAKWPKDTSHSSLLESLNDADLTFDNVTFSGSKYANVSLHGHQNTPQEWLFNLQQKNVVGDFTYNWNKNSLSAHITHLNVEALQESSHSKWSPKIESIPNLNILIDQITYHDVEMGAITLKSSTQPGHWTLNKGTIQTPEYELIVKGDWVEQGKGSVSNIEANLSISKLAKAFERWHVTPAVDAHYGLMNLSGKWPGPIYDASLKKLNGNMSLTLKNGHISHLDRETEQKLGLGKLLSILSLQTIPRRLKLDFSDLVQKGFTFDLFKGNFNIQHGVMSTTDSHIDGPVAFGRMTGDLDLVNQLYDLDLRIYPYITASLPVVATLAGGPVAGIATWALSNLASKGMQRISGYSYKISGQWLKPVVQQVSLDKSVH